MMATGAHPLKPGKLQVLSYLGNAASPPPWIEGEAASDGGFAWQAAGEKNNILKLIARVCRREQHLPLETVRRRDSHDLFCAVPIPFRMAAITAFVHQAHHKLPPPR